MVELVIFDCDGVLVDSEAIANQTLLDALAREGLNLSLAQSMAAFNGFTLDAVGKKAEAMLGRKLPADFLSRMQADTLRAFQGHLQPVAGVEALIARIKAAGIKDCVASSGGHDKMAITLSETGLLDHFKGRIFSASDVGKGKPEPDLFLHAARRMGVSPEHCLVIEDSLPGVIAARRADMPVHGYVPHGDAAAFAAAGAMVVRDLAQIQIAPPVAATSSSR